MCINNMNRQVININSGEFMVSNNFSISDKTTPQQLVAYFEKDKLHMNDMQNGYSNYCITNFGIGNLYFNITIYFKQLIKVNQLTSIAFILSDTPYSNSTKSWDNFTKEKTEKDGQFMKNWLTKQLANSNSKFNWGTASVNYDQHNFSYTCNIRYRDAITGETIH